MSPKNNKKISKLFGTFEINKIYEVKKFLPNKNEKWKKHLHEQINLNPATYLFKQRNFIFYIFIVIY